jgi:hypothetical protein
MSDNSVCLFTTIRATLADTLAFVYYHLNIGVDHIYLFFDDPDDPAMEMLRGESRVTCIRCDENYWTNQASTQCKSRLGTNAKLEINSRIAIKMAREHDYSWICHIDSDELIHASGSLKQAIAVLPPNVQVAKFPVLEAIPEKLSVQSTFRDLCYFKRAPVLLPKIKSVYLDPSEFIPFCINNILYRIDITCARIRGCNLAYKNFIKGQVMGKSIARTSTPMVSFRSHFPIPDSQGHLQINLLPDIKILHYDATDYEHWKTKWQIRYTQYQNGIIPIKPSRYRKQQYDEFARIYEQGKEEDLVALYKSIYFVSPSDLKILQKIGLVTEIHLADVLFYPPSIPE